MPTNRAGDRNGRIYGFLIRGGRDLPSHVVRPDGTFVFVRPNPLGGDPLWFDEFGEPVPEIPPGRAPYMMTVDDDGTVRVLIDANGEYTWPTG